MARALRHEAPPLPKLAVKQDSWAGVRAFQVLGRNRWWTTSLPSIRLAGFGEADDSSAKSCRG